MSKFLWREKMENSTRKNRDQTGKCKYPVWQKTMYFVIFGACIKTINRLVLQWHFEFTHYTRKKTGFFYRQWMAMKNIGENQITINFPRNCHVKTRKKRKRWPNILQPLRKTIIEASCSSCGGCEIPVWAGNNITGMQI